MVLAKDGRVVHVDYVPLTNNRYYRYFRHGSGKDVSTNKFFERFAKRPYLPRSVRDRHQ
jgi:hypothetical protein